ncbi:MAG: SAM-dependent methyltransferase [Candidatus Omnitrophica bacterium]|nr:SAM-dependent methyltransferase [Candidatus Omnitrophota bacterium]
MKGAGIHGKVAGSFRDPSGFLFYKDGELYRQVNACYKEQNVHFMRSGLYSYLVDRGMLISHKECDIGMRQSEEAYTVIKPELLPFISYPYEWCFSQLKTAALLTIKIQKAALEFGMSLKDCSAYNIQFRNGKAILIDTLSFEIYQKGKPWVAYRQFCQHFLAPLALMQHRDIRLSQLLRVHIDGIPLDLASALLPFYTWFLPSLLFHIHIHAKSQQYFSTRSVKVGSRSMSRLALLGLIDSLESTTKQLKWEPGRTEWANYYEDTNYSLSAFENKKRIVATFLEQAGSRCVWDIAANVGIFSQIAADKGMSVLSFDIDPACVERHYRNCLERDEIRILPLLLDVANPSPGIGWQNCERMSLFERRQADTALALALVHHLSISHNLPFENIAYFFSRICHFLIIEFVPKEDSQAQRLLRNRDDIFSDYTQLAFERDFQKFFMIEEFRNVEDSQRVIYLMRRKDS